MEVMDKIKNENPENKKNEESASDFDKKSLLNKNCSLDMETNDVIKKSGEHSNSSGQINKDRIFSVMESLLFSSENPLKINAFSQAFESIGPRDIKKILEELKLSYENSNRGVCLEEINGGWQLRTKIENREFLQKLVKSRPFRLSGPALEVLSIIAYRQPVIKSEVDRIRGVESGHLMRSLMEKRLISFQGKSDLPGKPLQYGTTTGFLEVFGLKNLKELPSLEEIDQLLPDGIGNEDRQDQELGEITDKMSVSRKDPDLYGEKELMAIGETLKKIKTTIRLPDEGDLKENPKEKTTL